MAARVLSRFSAIRGAVGRSIAAQSRQDPIGASASIHSLSSRSLLVPSRSSKPLGALALLNARGHRRFGFFSSASAQSNEKEAKQSAELENEQKESASVKDDEPSAEEPANIAGTDSGSTDSKKKRRKNVKRFAFSESDEELELSRDELIQLVAEKEEQLNLKQKEMEAMKDKLLRSYAEMENVMNRTKREAENSKKFAIQSFAKSLLDVSDNLGRASSVVNESFLKIDTSKDTAGAVPLLKTLLEGVEMTEKQLAETFKKFGVVKIDPLNEQFDPNMHMAVFQVPDPSKPPGTVASVLKSGYMLYDRVIRPAEVGVTCSPNNESEESSTA